MPKPRGKANKPLKPKMHIFCEGAKTEPNYINGYLERLQPGNRLLKVIKIEKTKKNTPVQLVDEAIKLKRHKDTPGKDVFWVVYDREAEAKYSDELHKKARDKATSSEVNIAFSSICFEVWLLLHFDSSTKPYSCFEDLLKNSKLKENLKALGIDNYDKADITLFNLISEKVPDARKRAVHMNRSILNASDTTEKNPHLLNPYTNVHELLDAIDAFVNKS